MDKAFESIILIVFITVKDHHWTNVVYNVGPTMGQRWTNDDLPILAQRSKLRIQYWTMVGSTLLFYLGAWWIACLPHITLCTLFLRLIQYYCTAYGLDLVIYYTYKVRNKSYN